MPPNLGQKSKSMTHLRNGDNLSTGDKISIVAPGHRVRMSSVDASTSISISDLHGVDTAKTKRLPEMMT